MMWNMKIKYLFKFHAINNKTIFKSIKKKPDYTKISNNIILDN